jgi:hypothetical protein
MDSGLLSTVSSSTKGLKVSQVVIYGKQVLQSSVAQTPSSTWLLRTTLPISLLLSESEANTMSSLLKAETYPEALKKRRNLRNENKK